MTHGFDLTDIPPFEEIDQPTWEALTALTAQTPISSKSSYWGAELLLEEQQGGFVWKRIDMNEASQSSLEYHVRKREVYHLIHGELDIGIRIGRGRNYILHMSAGYSFKIPPGLMHMRIAKTDVVIVEWASHNDPKDSHIVEDGRSYNHNRYPAPEVTTSQPSPNPVNADIHPHIDYSKKN